MLFTCFWVLVSFEDVGEELEEARKDTIVCLWSCRMGGEGESSRSPRRFRLIFLKGQARRLIPKSTDLKEVSRTLFEARHMKARKRVSRSIHQTHTEDICIHMVP